MAKKTKETTPKDERDKSLAEIKSKEKALKQDKKLMKQKEKSEAKKVKKLEDGMKKRRVAKSKLPTTSQRSIPYIADYDNGLIEIQPNVYSKTIDFSDVNYHVARFEDQLNIFSKWGECLNSFDSSVGMSYTINNKPVNEANTFEEISIKPLTGHEEDCAAYNSMLMKQFTLGRSDITREKYMTLTIKTNGPYEAMQKFTKIENSVVNSLSRTGSNARVQSTERRLAILHDFFRLENTGELHLDWDNVKSQGLSSKDFIAPSSMTFKPNSFQIDETHYRCAYLSNLPTSLVDDILYELTNFNIPMMCTVSVQAVDMDKAVKMVRHRITGMEQEIVEKQKKAVKAGYDPAFAINHDLKFKYSEAESLLENIQTQNQKIFYATIVILFSGKTEEELRENQQLIEAVAKTKLCQLQIAYFQQEEAFKQVLPLGHNVLPLKRTLTTESLSVFIPFTSQELNHKDGIYYSLNKVTKNMLRVNRKKLLNQNGFIFGESGCGKSFVVKKEIIGKFLSFPNEHIYIIDPEAEYGRLVEKLGGQIVKVGVGSDTRINICDMAKDYAKYTSGDPVAEKVDFLLSVCEKMARGLTASHISIIDHVAGLIYREYLQDYDEEKLPTFQTLYQKILEQPEEQAKDLGLSLRTYATGSLSIFAEKTNVDLKNRLVCFDISGLGKNLQDIGLMVISELIWNKLCEHRNQISSSVYIDEFHLMFKTEASENFAEQIFARIRKYGGGATGITQNVDTLMQSEKARGMMGNASFTIMLNQSDTNQKILSTLFSIGEEQLSYITNADRGCGLIRAGGVIVPFGDEFPKDNKLYRYMTSDPDEIKMFDEMEERERKIAEKQSKLHEQKENAS